MRPALPADTFQSGFLSILYSIGAPPPSPAPAQQTSVPPQKKKQPSF
jgi:hypothetical protein